MNSIYIVDHSLKKHVIFKFLLVEWVIVWIAKRVF